MNAGLYQSKIRRWLLTLMLATMLAVAALSVPVLADLAGVSLTSPIYACQTQPGGGCG